MSNLENLVHERVTRRQFSIAAAVGAFAAAMPSRLLAETKPTLTMVALLVCPKRPTPPVVVLLI